MKAKDIVYISAVFWFLERCPAKLFLTNTESLLSFPLQSICKNRVIQKQEPNRRYQRRHFKTIRSNIGCNSIAIIAVPRTIPSNIMFNMVRNIPMFCS